MKTGTATLGERATGIGLNVLTGAVLIFLVAPILTIVPLSFSSGSFFYYPLPGLSLRWYEDFFTSAFWLSSLKNSLIIGVSATVLATVLGTLAALGIPCETRIVSAHRTPKRLFAYASGAKARGLKVIIAGAGGAAHLPGMLAAANTTAPVRRNPRWLSMALPIGTGASRASSAEAALSFGGSRKAANPASTSSVSSVTTACGWSSDTWRQAMPSTRKPSSSSAWYWSCIAAKAINPKVQVIAVQSAEAPAGYRSWKEHRLVTDRMATMAEGLATRVAFELPQQILWEKLDDFVLVHDDEIRHALRLMIETTRNLAEPSGAAPLAAALQLKDRLVGKRIALILSGANITPAQLREWL